MQALSEILTAAELQTLRAAYDPDAVLALKVRVTSASFPAHAPWAEAIRDTFYGEHGLTPPQRELSIITLLAYRGPVLPFATHVYTGLMEGLSVAEICGAIGLAGCYAGLTTYTESMAVVRKTLDVLKRMASQDAGAEAVLMAIAAAFAR
jgi:alkylhydroperoxidase/carboxymuconolactone decarboxylase family protein YurZ